MAINLDIRPLEGVGPVRLGASRADCRTAFDETPGEPRRTGTSEAPTDVMLEVLHVYYDEEDRAEYIEIARGGGVRPLLDGVALLEVPVATAVATVERRALFDDTDPELGRSYVFRPIALSLWRPVDDDAAPDGRTFATVGVGRAGYYG